MKKEYLTKSAVQKTEGRNNDGYRAEDPEQLYRAVVSLRMEGRPVSYRQLTRKAARLKETGQYMMPDFYLSDQGDVIADYHRVPEEH